MEITYVPIQNVAIGQNVLFTDEPIPSTQKCIVHRDGSGIVTLRGITKNQCKARFLVNFNGNIALPTGGTVGEISVAIAIAGEQVSSSLAAVTPAAVGEFFNVSSSIYIDVPAGCCIYITVQNTSEAAIEVRNANLIVTRVA